MTKKKRFSYLKSLRRFDFILKVNNIINISILKWVEVEDDIPKKIILTK